MKIAILDQRHPEYDGDAYLKNRALYAGGDEILKDPVLSLLLHKGDMEPARRYQARKARAHYVNHCAGLVDQFVAWEFTAEPTVAHEPEVQLDDFWTRFEENCDRQGSDFAQYQMATQREVLITKRVWTLVELPARHDGVEAKTLADEDAAGLRDAYLVMVPAEAVIDWERGPDGQLLWAVVRNETRARPSPDAPRGAKTIFWTIYTPGGWQRFKWTAPNKDKQQPDPEEEALLDASGTHSFGAVPLVEKCLPDGLYLLGKIGSTLVESFNARNAQSWGFYTAMFAMPVVHSDAEDIDSKLFGNGYALVVGREDSITLLEPQGLAFTAGQAHIGELKDELFRIAHQMALSVDNSAGAMQRSGESKAQDQTATEIVLGAYAQATGREHAEIKNLVARGRGEKLVFTVTPPKKFTVESTADVLTEVQTAASLNIPSKTFTKRMYQKAAFALLSDGDEKDVEAIKSEIEDAVESGSIDRLEVVGLGKVTTAAEQDAHAATVAAQQAKASSTREQGVNGYKGGAGKRQGAPQRRGPNG